MISRRELVRLAAGAAAIQGVAEAHAAELPKDTITQRELETITSLEAALNLLVLGLHRRVRDGAVVEKGELAIEPEWIYYTPDGDFEKLEEYLNGWCGCYDGIDIVRSGGNLRHDSHHRVPTAT